MDGYQQLFALTKNPKYVKMCFPKTGRPPELNNTANAGRIVRGRDGRKILPAFLLPIFVAVLAIAAIPQEKKARRNRFGADQEKKFCKKPLGRYGRKIVKGEARSRPCMPQSECGAGHTGYRIFSDFVAGRITGHRRSLPQPSSAAWCPRLLTRAEVKDLHTAAY